jgi:protoheme IX farnesyltransferase
VVSPKELLAFVRFTLSTAVTISAVLTFIIFQGLISDEIILPVLAIWLLAFGTSALNQCQERVEDSKMQRTKDRPVANGNLSLRNGYIISITLISISFLLIYLSINLIGVVLFASVVFIYNYAYTTMKKTSIYAAVYGAILGVIPPYIGYLATGSDMIVQFTAIGIFYFVWQIPHFWLLALKYHDQYENAGFASMVHSFGEKGLERITFIWLLLTMLCGSFSMFMFDIKSYTLMAIFVLLSIYVLYVIFEFKNRSKYKKMFIHINIYILATMIILTINALI